MEENAGSAVIRVQGRRISSWLDGGLDVLAPDWSAWLPAVSRLSWYPPTGTCPRHARACRHLQHADLA